MSAIGEIGTFFARETAAAATTPSVAPITVPPVRQAPAPTPGADAETEPDASALRV